jgi:NADPH-dependent curcumin reductase CurA
MTTNHQVRLKSRPVGLPTRADWSFTEESVAGPGDGTFLVKILYISLDPAMRGWLNESRSYIAPVAVGDVMRALALGRVIASDNPAFAAGDYVSGPFGVQEYALSDGRAVLKVDPKSPRCRCT